MPQKIDIITICPRCGLPYTRLTARHHTTLYDCYVSRGKEIERLKKEMEVKDEAIRSNERRG